VSTSNNYLYSYKSPSVPISYVLLSSYLLVQLTFSMTLLTTLYSALLLPSLLVIASAYQPDESPWSLCKSTSPYPDLLTASFEDISNGLDQGLFTAVELTTAYIARIQETQPILRAVIEVNPHALEEAAAADAARKSGSKAALLGIPIIVKDNIATARPEFVPPRCDVKSY